MNDANVECIEHCISELVDKFIVNPYYFLSEADLQSYLYSRILCQIQFAKEYVTENGIVIGLVHREYRTSYGERFDLVVLDPTSIKEHKLEESKILCGIEIGLNRTFNHFIKDYSSGKFIKEAGNKVAFGYVLHFVRGFRDDWNRVVQSAKEAAEENDSVIVRLIESEESKVIAIKIFVEDLYNGKTVKPLS